MLRYPSSNPVYTNDFFSIDSFFQLNLRKLLKCPANHCAGIVLIKLVLSWDSPYNPHIDNWIQKNVTLQYLKIAQGLYLNKDYILLTQVAKRESTKFKHFDKPLQIR